MRLHFFTVRNIEDYRKGYKIETLAHKILKTTSARNKEEFDQEFLSSYAISVFGVPEGIYQSRIWGDTGFPGLRLDFNYGLRLDIPEGNFRVKVSDFDSEQVFFDKYISGGRLLSAEQYFVRYHVEVFMDDKLIFSHVLNLEGKPVAIKISGRMLGDALAFLPYIKEFKRINRCKLSVCPDDNLRELIAQLYPDFTIIDEIDFNTYATYYPLMMAANVPVTPGDYRQVSLCNIGGRILGINYIPPKATFKPTAPPVTDEPYVCISVQSSMTTKSWLYPGGWDVVVDYLKSLGYRVFCIDRRPKEENNGITVCKPEGAEDFTGNHPLTERANMLYHAQFFIGLSSGLSWLADAVDCPVVMICGFSQDWSEFYTPYRVANRKVCNGCVNDICSLYVANPCAYHKNTKRAYECQKKIPPRMVINAIERLIVDKNLTPPAIKAMRNA